MENRGTIDQINEWVRQYKEEDNKEALTHLLEQFSPFLKKQCRRFCKLFPGVHPYSHVIHEARIIFMDLLDEYTIGGPAYFNVFIQRKLPFRLRYFFTKEIRRRSRDLSHDEEQFTKYDLIGVKDDTQEVVEDMDRQEKMDFIMNLMYEGDLLTEREVDMVTRSIVLGQRHEDIAALYGISRSRVTRIVNGALKKLREEAELCGYF